MTRLTFRLALIGVAISGCAAETTAPSDDAGETLGVVSSAIDPIAPDPNYYTPPPQAKRFSCPDGWVEFKQCPGVLDAHRFCVKDPAAYFAEHVDDVNPPWCGRILGH